MNIFEEVRQKIADTILAEGQVSWEDTFAVSACIPETGEYVNVQYATHDESIDSWDERFTYTEWSSSHCVLYLDTELDRFYAKHPHSTYKKPEFGVLAYAASTAALSDVKAQNHFGEYSDEILLNCQVMMDDDCIWLASVSANLLNSHNLYIEFLESWEAYVGDSINDYLAKPVVEQYLNYLRQNTDLVD